MTLESSSRAKRDQQLFDRIAINYSKKDQYMPAQLARKMRLLQTVKNIPKLDALDMLEVGCGSGYSAKYLNNFFRTYTGVDYSKELIHYANIVNKSDKITFDTVDFYDMPSNKQYDVILMVGVLHHMQDIPAAVRQAYKLLKPGGCLIANEPQSTNIIIQLLRKIRATLDSSYSSEQRQLDENELIADFQQGELHKVDVFAQGFFSTPFAEVMLKPEWLFSPLSHFSCILDRWIESSILESLLKKVAWNIVVIGYK